MVKTKNDERVIQLREVTTVLLKYSHHTSRTGGRFVAAYSRITFCIVRVERGPLTSLETRDQLV